MVETEYDGLAALRAALTADDPDERAPAYGAVYEADLEPSEVLGQEPPEDRLVEAGVIPSSEDRGRTTQDTLEEIATTLNQILVELEGQ